MPIPVYVINLDRRADRMARMAERLHGIEHVRISAIDGGEIVDWRQGLDLPAGSTFNSYEFACVQSHLRAAREVLAQNHACACILEDDVILSDDFSKFIGSREWIPDGVDLIKCETMGSKVWVSRSRVGALGRSLLKLKSFHPGTAGYFITRQGAQKMVQLLSRPTRAADDLIFDQALQQGFFGEILQLVPAICMQELVLAGDNNDSDIQCSRDASRAGLRAPVSVLQKAVRELKRPFLQLLGMGNRVSRRRIIVPFE